MKEIRGLGQFLGEILKRDSCVSLKTSGLPVLNVNLASSSPWSFSLILGPYDVFNFLDGPPACSLTSAGHWESETIQT